MDNDNKIESKELTSQQRHKDVLLFLNEELNNIQTTSSSSDTYNLEREYAKTKKNKSPFVFFVLFACVAITLGVAYLMSHEISKRSQQIPVNLEEFDSLNLRALLDSVARVQDRYDVAVQELEMEQSAMDNELKTAQNKKNDDLFVLESLSELDTESFAARRTKIYNEYNTKVRQIKEQYEGRIAELQTKVDQYKQELDSYDSNDVASAKAQEQELTGGYNVQEMERKKLIDSYEARIKDLQIRVNALTSSKTTRSAVNQVSNKYQAEINKLDPLIKDEKADELIKNNLFKFSRVYDSQDLLEENQNISEEVKALLLQYQELYDNYKYLRNYIASVPQKKSIPDYVSTTNKFVDQMGQTFSDATIQLNKKTIELQEQIVELNTQMQQLVQAQEQEKSALEQYYKRINFSYSDCLNLMLSQMNANAVVAYATAKDNIGVFVIPRARVTLNPEGTNVKIYGKNVVNGRIVPYENGYYYFVPSLDEEGNQIDFNFKDVVAGSLVEILN